jgi:hypothetical protein
MFLLHGCMWQHGLRDIASVTLEPIEAWISALHMAIVAPRESAIERELVTGNEMPRIVAHIIIEACIGTCTVPMRESSYYAPRTIAPAFPTKTVNRNYGTQCSANPAAGSQPVSDD